MDVSGFRISQKDKKQNALRSGTNTGLTGLMHTCK